MRKIHLVASVLLIAALQGCATGGYTPDAEPAMPAARQSMRPEYRLFYDALVDYGDWILIEPYGYVFRPDVNFVAWRPYIEGFWAPSAVYGWIWVSSEPFGWATYHYGEWTYDRFQGWVWLPGLHWGPAWVEWEASDQFVGWAPLMPPGSGTGNIPGGWFVYVPTLQMANTDLTANVLNANEVDTGEEAPERVRNLVEVGGVMINRGPKFERIERVAGPLPRVNVEDLIPVGTRLNEATSPAPGTPALEESESSEDAVRVTRRAGDEIARQARTIVKSGALVPRQLPIVRPIGPGDETAKSKPAPAARKPKAPKKKAAADTTVGR